ncbi:LOW QUALITY PROTEIN: protein RRNAD1 [Danio aesculapii]|uniref:LOW QUALITY PROTEIN: protein RRNAD1 n=1 Tax=Danio aesculapii TaxID=1142201 RepID=UPI0024BF1F95|nr:LOW QUALITY PROTEIN: protein RRNAD1 [Danio aesculapii]
MFVATFSEQEQRELAEKLTSLLSTYRHISDSYIIEFFSESLWETLPVSWQEALGDLTPPMIADLLLDNKIKDRRYSTVWPLSLLALRTAAHALTFPRAAPGGHQQNAGVAAAAEEFQSNHSQSSLLGHIFRKHVKPKKQHEIRRLGMLVKELCDQGNCNRVVDVGSGQGHLTRFLSFGLGLHVTGIEADPNLVSMATKFDRQLLQTLTKENQSLGKAHLLRSAPGPPPRHVVGWVNPKASWDVFIQQLGMTATESDSTGATTEKKQRVEDLHLEPHSCQTKAEDLQNTLHGQKTASQTNTSIFPSGTATEMLTCKTIPIPKRDPGSFVLTGLHACGDLSATLLRHFTNCPHVSIITSVACCYMKISTQEHPNPPGVFQPPFSSENTAADSCLEFSYPMSNWIRGLAGHQLSYKAREGACHAIEEYLQRLREENALLRTHCYRAILENIIRSHRPDIRRPGVQTVKKAHMLSFSEYARLALPRVGLPADLPFDSVCVDAMLAQQGKVVVYFSLVLLLAPVVETLVLLDRVIFLQERGFQSKLIPLFDAAFSPRNLVLVAVKSKEA